MTVYHNNIKHEEETVFAQIGAAYVEPEARL